MIDKQLQRRSERDLKSQPLSKEIINKLKEVANSSASSINGQAASLVFITDQQLKDNISKWNWNQEHIKKAPLFILFLVDFQRLHYAFKKNNVDLDLDNDTTFDELLKVGLVDATIKAQAIVDAALDMDLGTCYIGGVRTYQDKIIKEMNLPEQVIPVLGLTIGYINSQEEVKPKMDTTFDNQYSTKEMNISVDVFDKEMANYYNARDDKKKGHTWSSNTATTYKTFFDVRDFYKIQKELMDKKYKK